MTSSSSAVVEAQARESLNLVSRWLAKLGLTIHPDKSRLCWVWEEPFDFLGYTFRSHRRLPHRPADLDREPFEESREETQGEDRHHAASGKSEALARAALAAQPSSDGMGQLLQLRMDGSRRRCDLVACRQPRPAIPLPTTQAPTARSRPVFCLGGLRLSRSPRYQAVPRSRKSTRACLVVKPVREPCAGEPHARFDEWGRETELW